MRPISLWGITNDVPTKFEKGEVELEAYLEEWIEKQPSLLQHDLVIVGRQLNLKGRPIDLLAIDAIGNWVVIEIKRDRLYRSVITQAIDYAADVDSTPFHELHRKIDEYLISRDSSLRALLEERGVEDSSRQADRDIIIYIVGTGKEPDLERNASYLTNRYKMPINIITFNVFEGEGGQRVLVRELSETEANITALTLSHEISANVSGKIENIQKHKTFSPPIEELCSIADREGNGQAFRIILDAARRHDLYPRTYRNSVMYTPPNNRSRMLFTVRPRARQGLLNIYVGPSAFSEFYPISERTVTSILDPINRSAWYRLTTDGVKQFVAGLETLFKIIENPN